MTPRGQSLPVHQKVLLFFSFFGKVKQQQASIKEWLKSAKQRRFGEQAISVKQGIRTESQAGFFERRQSTGRFSLCFFVNSSAFFRNFARSLVYSSARSALSGCSGWGMFTIATRHWITAGNEKQAGVSVFGTDKRDGKNDKCTFAFTLVGFCGRLPVLHTDDGQADLALFINVGVVDFCLEGYLRRLEGILCREVDLNPKCSFVIWMTVLGENKNKWLSTITCNCKYSTNASDLCTVILCSGPWLTELQ